MVFCRKTTYPYAMKLKSIERRRLIRSGAALGTVCTAIAPLSFQRQARAAQLSNEQTAAHLLNRLGFGPRPGDLTTVAADPKAWIKQQLNPSAIPLPETLISRLNESAFTAHHPGKLVMEFRELQRVSPQVEAAPQVATAPNNGNNSTNSANPVAQFVAKVARPAIESRLLRALESPRQLEEVMVDFWFNHFNIFQGKNFIRVMTGHYEHYAIRPFAMGRFRDLLGATARHPAMLYYLDNALSVAPGTGGVNRGLNENYARELMELHTLGVDGGYQQKDVTELARMLTGWSIQRPEQSNYQEAPAMPGKLNQMPGFGFNERIHDKGHKEWLGHKIAPQGQTEGEFALDTLAKHPATAKHIAFKLAQYFVSDKPDTSLVSHLSEVFLASDGAITTVLAALFSHASFWDAKHVGVKFKTPYQYVLSSVRASGQTPPNLQLLAGAMAAQGMPLYGCPTPDGYKNTEVAWLNPDAMTKRINFATALGAAKTFSSDDLLQTLGPLVSETTKKVAQDAGAAADVALAKALIFASPGMMRR
jgi:uncharacterized protein (DUF1800 family)